MFSDTIERPRNNSFFYSWTLHFCYRAFPWPVFLGLVQARYCHCTDVAANENTWLPEQLAENHSLIRLFRRGTPSSLGGRHHLTVSGFPGLAWFPGSLGASTRHLISQSLVQLRSPGQTLLRRQQTSLGLLPTSQRGTTLARPSSDPQ